MTFSEEQIEWIVVEVIRRLGLLEKARVAANQGNSSAAELVVAEKVVTMRSLEGRLANVSRSLTSWVRESTRTRKTTNARPCRWSM